MTSWTSPRRATIRRYDGSASSASRTSSACRSSSTVSSSGTNPTRATSADRSTSPASRARTTAASTSSAPMRHRDDRGLARRPGRSGRGPRRTATNVDHVRIPASSSGGGVGASGRARGELGGEQARAVVAGQVLVAPALLAEPVDELPDGVVERRRRARARRGWPASDRSRPRSAPPIDDALRRRARRGARGGSRGRAAGRRRSSRVDGVVATRLVRAPLGDARPGAGAASAWMQVTLRRYGSSALSRR